MRPKGLHNWIVEAIHSVLILFLSLYYVRSVINSELLFQMQETTFYTGFRFLRLFLPYPGGLTRYISDFFMQFTFFPWQGVFVCSALVLLIWILSTLFYRRLSGPAPYGHVAAWIPPALFLMSLGRFVTPLSIGTGWIVAMAMLLVYEFLRRRLPKWRFLVFGLMQLIVYYVADFFVILFVLLSILIEWADIRYQKRTVLIQTIGMLLPLLAMWVVANSNTLVVEKMIPYGIHWGNDLILSVLLTCFYLFLPINALFHVIRERGSSEHRSRRTTVLLRSVRPFRLSGIFLIFLMLAAGLRFSPNRELQTALLTDYNARQTNWPAILKLFEEKTQAQPLASFQLNRALYHTGRLLSEMFHYAQPFGRQGLILPRQVGFSVPMAMSDLFFDMIYLNGAQQWALEDTAPLGDTAYNIRRLVDISLLKGDRSLAIVYLNSLKKTLVYGEWAQRALGLLENGESLIPPETKRRIETGAPKNNFIGHPVDLEADVESLFEDNSNNHMAFEYLIANYMLSFRLGRLIDRLPDFRKLGYNNLPRHVEEAILIYRQNRPGTSLDLQGYTLSKPCLEDFRALLRTLNQYDGDIAAAHDVLKERFGGSYWFYSLTQNPTMHKEVYVRKS